MRKREDGTRLDNLERKVDNLLTTVTDLRRYIRSMEGEMSALRQTRPTPTPPPARAHRRERWTKARWNGPILILSHADLWTSPDGMIRVKVSGEHSLSEWTFPTFGAACVWLEGQGYTFHEAAAS